MDEKEKEELLKEIEKKIEDYTKKIEKNPNNASYYYNRGNAYRNRGNTFKNLERLQEAVEDFKKAIESYDKAIELNPNNASYYNNRGIAFKNLGDYDKAIEDYDKAIELNPNNASYYNNRGLALNILGNNKEAIESYDKAIELNPNNASYYNNRGIAFKNLGDYDKAINNYSQAINLDPKEAIYYNNRGLTLNILGNNKEAIESYDKAIELNPNNASYYNNRGLVFNNLGDYQKAIEDYEKAIELNPNYSLPYNNRGISFYNLKEYEKAIEDYEKAIELNPNYSLAYNNRGNAYKNLGNYQKAIEDYEKAIELNPNNDSAKKLILELKRNEENESIQQDKKILDTTENKDEINKEENSEPTFTSDYNIALDLHLNEKFEEAEKEFSDFINKYKDSPNKSLALDNHLTEAALYLIASKAKVKRLKGYLIFADILGWKGIWKKFSLTEEKFGVVNRLLTIRIELENEIKKQNSICSMNLISDTFIIYSQSFEMSKNLSKKLMTLCLERELPIRGAISYGECYNRETVYVGPAVDEAASWHDEGEEIGIFCTPSVRQEIINNNIKKTDLLEGFMELKSGGIETFFVNWHDEEKNKENFYNLFSKIDKSSIKVYLKYLNTEKKFDEYMKDSIKE